MERLVWARSLARPQGQEERKAEFLVSRCSAWRVIRVRSRSWERLKLLWEYRTQAPNSGPEDLEGGRWLSPKRSILGLRLEGRGGADLGRRGQQMQRSRGAREPGAWERRDVWGRQGGWQRGVTPQDKHGGGLPLAHRLAGVRGARVLREPHPDVTR